MANGANGNSAVGDYDLSGVQFAGLVKKKSKASGSLSQEALDTAAKDVVSKIESGAGDAGSIKDTAIYIKGLTKNMNERETILDSAAAILKSEKDEKGDLVYTEGSVDSTIDKIRNKLNQPLKNPATKTEQAAPASAVEEAAPAKAKPTAKFVSAELFGNPGSDGTPQYMVTYKVTGLPENAAILNVYITKDGKWGAGSCPVHEGDDIYKISGAYLSHATLPFSIEVVDNDGTVIARIKGNSILKP